MPDNPSDKVEVIKAVFDGLNKMILALSAFISSGASIWIQVASASKLSETANATVEVKTQLDNHDAKLEKIEKSAVASEKAADASAKSWKAYETKDPDDMDRAAKALAIPPH